MPLPPAFLRGAALVSACLAAGTAYLLDALPVFAKDIKHTFQVSQSQVEAVITLGYLGMLSSLPAGLLCRLIGPRCMSMLAWLISITGALFLLTTINYLDFHRENFSLLYFYFFLLGAGGGLMFVVASSVTINNFDSQDLGLTMGMVTAFRSAVPGIIIIAYIWSFSPDYYDNTYSEARLRTLFLVMTSAYCVANVLGMITYGFYRQKSRAQSLLETGALRRRFETKITESTALLFKTNTSPQRKRWWSNLVVIEYQLLFWPSVIILGFRTSYVSNISTFAFSFSFQQYSFTEIILTLLPFVSILSKPAIGFCSDSSLHKIPRSAFLLLASVFFVLALVMCLLMFDSVIVQGTVVLFLVVVSGYVQTLVPSLFVSLFGRTSFPVVFGFLTMGWSIFTSIFNSLLGAFYDLERRNKYLNECFGTHCYELYFVVALAFAMATVMCYAMMVRIEAKLRINVREIRQRITSPWSCDAARLDDEADERRNSRGLLSSGV